MIIRSKKYLQAALIVIGAGFIAVQTTNVSAQAVPGGFPIPNSADISRVPQRFSTPETALSNGVEGIQIQQEQTTPPDSASTISLTLTTVAVNGATVYSNDDLSSEWRSKIGQKITLLDVYRIADRITARYRNDGYVLARAVVPPQKIDGGVVHIRIVEGYVSKVVFEGDAHGNQDILDAYADEIKESRPLSSAVLEHYLLLINDLPGVSASSLLQPDPAVQGAAILTMVLDYKPYSVFGGVDNRGSRYIGPIQMTTGGEIHSLFHAFDDTKLQAASVPGKEGELQFGEITESLPIDTYGTTASVEGAYTHSRPGFTLKNTDLESEDTTLTFGLAHPFIRSRAENLSVSGSFSFHDSRTDFPTFRSNLYIDRVRALRVGGSYDFVDTALWDNQAVNLFNFEVHEGIDGLGATPFTAVNKSRASGHSDFTKITGEMSRTQQLPDQFAIQVAATGQYSFDSLLSSEQFGLGGSEYLRAYDPSEFLGDEGIAGKIEFRYSDVVDVGILHSYDLYTYYDIGDVWNRHTAIGEPSSITAQAIGIGIRTSLTDYATAAVEIAQPIARNVTTEANKAARGFFSFQLHY